MRWQTPFCDFDDIILFLGEDTISLERGESSSPLDTSYDKVIIFDQITIMLKKSWV